MARGFLMLGGFMKVIRIPERRVEGKPLGRHVRHDPRSLRFLIEAVDPATLTSVRHVRGIPVLDQGDLGSCTGNAAEGALGTSPLYETVPAGVRRPTGDADADEQQAVSLYSLATSLDDYDGQYPPDDTGSDGLSVAKAAQKLGLISGYRHATSLAAALTALQDGPVITGVNWYSSFDSPAADGTISIGRHASVRGGHEFCVDELDVPNKRVGFTNSWGTSWGVEGRAYMSWDTWERLLSEDGDVTVFVPVTEPAPQPTPDPGQQGCAAQLIGIAEDAIARMKAVLNL
jgi:hypothetical protein